MPARHAGATLVSGVASRSDKSLTQVASVGPCQIQGMPYKRTPAPARTKRRTPVSVNVCTLVVPSRTCSVLRAGAVCEPKLAPWPSSAAHRSARWVCSSRGPQVVAPACLACLCSQHPLPLNRLPSSPRPSLWFPPCFPPPLASRPIGSRQLHAHDVIMLSRPQVPTAPAPAQPPGAHCSRPWHQPGNGVGSKRGEGGGGL